MTCGDKEKIRRFSSLERSPKKVNLSGRKVNLRFVIWDSEPWLGEDVRKANFHMRIPQERGTRQGVREIGGYTEPQEDTDTEFISPGDGHQFQRKATNLKICGLGYKSMLKRVHRGERDWRRKETRFACPDV
ncbi:unnamed protein product [Linum trigynum]|uniref:Uncharacterized protein n=1 Tax=Linum trigynum TaxID=586398 RepID=A0AAV2F2Z3_9ROSI